MDRLAVWHYDFFFFDARAPCTADGETMMFRVIPFTFAGSLLGHIILLRYWDGCKEKIFKINFSVLIELSKRNISHQGNKARVKFIHSDIRHLTLENNFDVVVTNFFLNVFKEEGLMPVMKHLILLFQIMVCGA
ncbi:MAG: class I SAM-dependent methyltransferase [Cytophagaceae bacterium]|nr:class I SAM-dependent methyltransferase [Cytophagaceae bacterium]